MLVGERQRQASIDGIELWARSNRAAPQTLEEPAHPPHRARPVARRRGPGGIAKKVGSDTGGTASCSSTRWAATWISWPRAAISRMNP